MELKTTSPSGPPCHGLPPFPAESSKAATKSSRISVFFPRPTEPLWTAPPPPAIFGLPKLWQDVQELCRVVPYLFVELIELGSFR